MKHALNQHTVLGDVAVDHLRERNTEFCLSSSTNLTNVVSTQRQYMRVLSQHILCTAEGRFVQLAS
jgi:hypothetical protein